MRTQDARHTPQGCSIITQGEEDIQFHFAMFTNSSVDLIDEGQKLAQVPIYAPHEFQSVTDLRLVR